MAASGLETEPASRARFEDELSKLFAQEIAAGGVHGDDEISAPHGGAEPLNQPERVQITADQCPRISAEHLAAERIRLGDALFRQEYFGAFVSAPGSVFDAEVLAHMFGDHTKEEPEEPAAIVQGRLVDRFLQ
jgi:hypothetical protein